MGNAYSCLTLTDTPIIAKVLSEDRTFFFVFRVRQELFYTNF